MNYIALLGWSPESDQEIYTLEELIQVFNIARISKSPAIFDIDKLTWMNGVYLRNMSVEEFHALILPILQKSIHRKVDLMAVARILQPRIDILSQIEESVDFIDELPEYDCQMYIHKKMKTTPEISLKALELSLIHI